MTVGFFEDADCATKVGAPDDIAVLEVAEPMRSNRGGPKLTVSATDRRVLMRLSRSPRLAYRAVVRSRIILTLAAGSSEREAAALLRVSRGTVARWRERYLRGGVGALLRDRPGRGRRARFKTAVVLERAGALARGLQQRGERVSLRRLARELGISYASLQRRSQHAGGLAISGPLDGARDCTPGNERCTASHTSHHQKKDRA